MELRIHTQFPNAQDYMKALTFNNSKLIPISQSNTRYKVVPLLMRVHPLLRSFSFTKTTLLQYHFPHLLNTILKNNFTSQLVSNLKEGAFYL